MNSKFPGVFETATGNGQKSFRSSFTYNGKHISLGSYKTAEAASAAYMTAHRIMKDRSIEIRDYSNDVSLKFDKFVSLINLRDNSIYFANPIYLCGKYFEYYFDSLTYATFDKDDLFYFSSHKIMKRGNHLFCEDFGAQVTIAQRFGIKAYSVAGRDHVFINGDNMDFRRENLEIINRYQGVRRKQTKLTVKYDVYIHINGDFKVGSYKSEEIAAIAYNKAIDILTANKVAKNFTPNYIESITGKEYAEIYSKVAISDKITNYGTVPEG